eukprot:TRINITY_DN21279_c2_g1_i5.p1 TRINITY_DN21279_c2_g1~~TRINITY_DN21279_c2_g1_i5.p1  ORF type:complete len:123 (-),score=17.22 TRINITY_DN21279_c2_g1_i5:262-630(-)
MAFGEDTRTWTASRNRVFAVSTFYSTLSAMAGRSGLASLWRFKAPPRVVAFGWIALRRRILTLDNLRKRGKTVVNACPVCWEDEETLDNLLLRSRYAVKLWDSVISWFDCKWVLPRSLQHHF